MRIVYVTSTLPTGPSETFIYPELQEIVRRGHEITVVPIRPWKQIIHEEGRLLLPFARSEALLSPRVLLGALLAALTSPAKAWRALRLMLTQKPTHLAKNLLAFPKALWLGRLAQRWPADHIHAHWVATTASMAMAASEYSGVPWSFTAHRWDILENNLIARKIAHAQFARFIAEKGVRVAELQGSVPRASQNVFVLHMGVPIEGRSAREVVSRGPRSFRFLCPANLIPRKGHQDLIEAVARLQGVSEVELWVAGDGELRSQLENITRDLGLEKQVRFLGRVDHKRLMDFYRTGEIDAVVLASIEMDNGFHEGIPVALIEAMSFGIPVIATASGGTDELLEDGAGILVPPRNPEALAAAMRRLSQDRAVYEEVGRRGLAKVKSEFEIGRIVDVLIQQFATATRSEEPDAQV